MPELPEVVLYLNCLKPRVQGETLERLRLFSPFLVRTVEPPLARLEGKRVVGLRRLGKRLVFHFESELFLILHLMLAGRLLWRERGSRGPGKITLAGLDFPGGTLLLTEASSNKRASLHLVQGEEALARHDPGGLEPLDADLIAFRNALLKENHTLKRALRSAHLFSGIGNAYADEILHAARLSPLARTQHLTPEEIHRLHVATRKTLQDWIDRLVAEVGSGFPEKITASRPDRAVHGRFGLPCPVCQATIQRIRYAENETFYCPRCQTGGKILADRSLSRLLREDWPRTLEEWENQH